MDRFLLVGYIIALIIPKKKDHLHPRPGQRKSRHAARLLAEQGLAAAGNLLVVSAGMPAGGQTNVLKLEKVGSVTP
jgi:hypothetical protein